MAWEKKRQKSSKITKEEIIYNDLMIDIETLGTDEDAVVLSIGAVKFRPDTRDDWETLGWLGRSFYGRFDEEQQGEDGRSTDFNTLQWWEKQSNEAKAVFDEEPEEVTEVLLKLATFAKGCRRIWGNGPDFDNTIMTHLYNDYCIENIFYWTAGDGTLVKMGKNRCVRTMRHLWNMLCGFPYGGKPPPVDSDNTVVHNALDDAKRQVLEVQKMYSDCKGTKYGA